MARVGQWIAIIGAACAAPVFAGDNTAAINAFAANCFSPFMTADLADKRLAKPGVRVDFYDLAPFDASNPVSPVAGRAQTPGTDRRCEVAFDGDRAADAAEAAAAALAREGITTEAPLPAQYAPTEGTSLLGARFLNPSRVAVVHTGTRPGPNGVETFLFVERMEPLE